MLKANNRKTRKRNEICSRLTIKTTERQRRSAVFVVNFEHIFTHCSNVSIVNFEHIITGWVEPENQRNSLFFKRKGIRGTFRTQLNL